MKLRSLRRPAVVAAASVAVLAVALSGTAVAKDLLTGDDIKNGSLTGKDIEKGSIKSGDIDNQTLQSRDIGPDAVGSSELRDGAVDLDHLSAAALAELTKKPAAGPDNGLVESNWGVVLRNTQAGGSAELRFGPSAQNFDQDVAPPAGSGSLQLLTGDGPRDKVAFGNEVDFAGDSLADIDAVGFSVYTTGENQDRAGVNNLPNINFEIDPNDPAITNGAGAEVGFSSLVFVPEGSGSMAGQWTQIDATTDEAGYWYFTNGATAAATNCANAADNCTFEDATSALPDATIHTVQVGKGSDHEFQGAVDALVIGDTTYDFEARGVIARKA